METSHDWSCEVTINPNVEGGDSSDGDGDRSVGGDKGSIRQDGMNFHHPSTDISTSTTTSCIPTLSTARSTTCATSCTASTMAVLQLLLARTSEGTCLCASAPQGGPPAGGGRGGGGGSQDVRGQGGGAPGPPRPPAPRPPAPARPAYQPASNLPTTPGVMCENCGKTNHTAAQCHSKPKNLAAAALPQSDQPGPSTQLSDVPPPYPYPYPNLQGASIPVEPRRLGRLA